MYRLMRNIHLILGLVFVLALGVYLVSSVRIAHRTWFPGGPTVTDQTFAVDPAQASTPRALALQLIENHGLGGELARVEPSEEGRFGLIIRRIGTNYSVEYEEGSAEAHVRTRRTAFSGMLMGLHFAHGFWHDDGMINLWGAVLLCTSLGLIALGLTGIYLWFKTYDERRIGAVLLIASSIFAAFSMYLVRSQG